MEFKKEAVANGTAIYFSALPTCVSLKGCEACISNAIGFEVIMNLSGMRSNKNLWLFTKTKNSVCGVQHLIAVRMEWTAIDKTGLLKDVINSSLTTPKTVVPQLHQVIRMFHHPFTILRPPGSNGIYSVGINCLC